MKNIKEIIKKVLTKNEVIISSIDRFNNFILEENKESNNIIDYYKSRYFILVGTKTNLLSNMKDRYDYEVNGDEIYFFDKGFHFATLFKEGRFYELKHDGTLDEYGWRKFKKS